LYKFPIPYEEDEDEDGVEGILTVEGNEEDLDGDIDDEEDDNDEEEEEGDDNDEEEEEGDDNDEDGVEGILTVVSNDFDEGVLYKFPIP
jgi:hypothetical protein